MSHTRILHLSDLHFGRNFQQQKWDELVDIAKKLRPDLIIITGDIVNTPWFWTLKRANVALKKLQSDLKFENNRKTIVFVPGNHDTRITGLFAITWLLGSGVISALIAAVLFYQGSTAIGSVMALTASIFFILRFVTTVNLKKYLGDFLVVNPLRLENLGVGILPFDSASTAKLGAHGRFPAKSILMCRETLNVGGVPEKKDGLPTSLFWIAAVHHHLLPLPYDAKHESVMIMENAGTLLQELITHSVPLVLHGHKHHQHFSKLTVKTRDGLEKQISVLAAGTPTEKFEAGVYQHSFNFLKISQTHRVDIEVYRAEAGGSFGKSEDISLASNNEYARRSYERYRAEKLISCSQMFSSAIIDRFGNAKLTREFSGVKTKKSLDSFPHDFPAECVSGEIVDIWVEAPSSSLPTVFITPEYHGHNSATCTVGFGGHLSPENDAINFVIGYEAINAFALNSIHFSQMYPSLRNNLESAAYAVPDCIAVEELLLQLRFPEGMKIPSKLILKSATTQQSMEEDGKVLPSKLITIVHGSSMVLARIPSPIPGSCYCFSWEVEIIKQQSHPKKLALEKALMSKVLPLRFKKDIHQFLRDALILATDTLVEPFPGLTAEEIYQRITLSLYGYDREKGILKVVATAGPDRPEIGKDSHQYGLGLAGHAFKGGKIVVYDKNSPESFAERYVRRKRRENTPDGVVSPHHEVESYEDIDDGDSNTGASIAVPIYAVDFPSPDLIDENFRGQPYAVVQISFDEAIGKIKLSDTYNDPAQSIFQAAMSKTVQNLISATILSYK